MKILWVGDAVVPSGFARCTHEVCDRLHERGHEVHILGINYFGDPHPYPYPIYPCVHPFHGGRDGFGVGRLPRLIEQIQPDLVMLLNDPWNIPVYLEALDDERLTCKPQVMAWLAVDAENQMGEPLNGLSRIVVWTEFAERTLRDGGYSGEASIVPLGVDLDLFYPREDVQSMVRPEGIPQDAFVVGVVGRNQPRKRLDLAIEYFAEWVHAHRIEDAYLYLHVGPTGDKGFDLSRLVGHYGLRSRVLLCRPPFGQGLEEELMPAVYSSMDVYWTTTQGEGWGLPCLEAMACGTPCLVPDFSGLGSWVGDAAVKVPCTSSAISAPLNALAYTVGGVPDKNATIKALQRLYTSPGDRAEYRERGLALAQGLTWERSARAMVGVIEDGVRVPALSLVGAS